MNPLYSAILGMLLLGGDDQTDKSAPVQTLREEVAVGTHIQTKLHLKIEGKIQVGKDEKSVAGQALLEYAERVLEVGPDGLAQRVARYYSDARAKFIVGKSQEARQLRPGLRLIIGGREGQKLALWSPAGPLTGDEHELVEDILETTRLPGLLPANPVKVGESWKPEPDAITALCDLDHFSESDLKCTLKSLESGKAKIAVAGSAQGIADGAEVKIKIDATAVYDTNGGILESLAWTQNDERGPSPVSPAGKYQVTIAITCAKTEPGHLSDTVLAAVGTEPNPASKLLVFDAPDHRYRFYHARNWHVTTLRPDRAVLRCLNESEFLAQLNITVLGDRQAGTEMNPEEFQAIIEKTAGWNIEQIVRVERLPTDSTFRLQLVSAFGRSGEMRLLQKHYLATSSAGRQIVFSFVMDPDNEAKLGTVDLGLVSTVEFPDAVAHQGEAEKQKAQ